MSRNTIIFMLEDFLGGHSAVGNLVMLALSYIVKNPHIGAKIQHEVDFISNNGERSINLSDMSEMPYTMATIFEVLRYSSSPIVPHVATEDTVISGFGVTTGTVVFINNYVLNKGSQYWRNPDKFIPDRFLEEKSTVKNLKEPPILEVDGRSENKLKESCNSNKFQLRKIFHIFCHLVSENALALDKIWSEHLVLFC